jgi:hypothetical protein
MQASKVIPGKTYAVKRGEKLLRFHAHSVETRMVRKGEKANPHDYSSKINGAFLDGDDKDTVSIDPDRLLDEYTAYAELVERKAQEDKAASDKDAAKKAARVELWELLYAKTGETPKTGTDKYFGKKTSIRYEGVYRVGYGDVTISDDGVASLVEVLKTLPDKKAAAA